MALTAGLDIPIVLSRLRPTDDWGPCGNTSSTYAQLVAGWRGTNPVPTEAEMNADWAAFQAEGGVSGQQNLNNRNLAKDIFNTLTTHDSKGWRALCDIILDQLNDRMKVIGEATVTFDPPNLADGAGVTRADIVVLGARFGDVVDLAPPYSLQGLLYSAYVHADDTIGVRLQNESGGAVNLGSGNWKVYVRRKVSNDLGQAKTLFNSKIDGGTVD